MAAILSQLEARLGNIERSMKLPGEAEPFQKTVEPKTPIELACSVLFYAQEWGGGVCDLKVVGNQALIAEAFSLLRQDPSICLVPTMEAIPPTGVTFKLQTPSIEGSPETGKAWISIQPFELMWLEMKASQPQAPPQAKVRFRRNEAASSRGETLTLKAECKWDTLCVLNLVNEVARKGNVTMW